MKKHLKSHLKILIFIKIKVFQKVIFLLKVSIRLFVKNLEIL